ncbi:MAG: dihydrodipicolinate synthase family protein [Chloroflexi bacterium]|nr:dihydrodipicolinate synthase family protein [Chloroflexota bacterium]
MKRLKVQGVIVPLLTPIAGDTIDQDGFARLIEFVIERGVSGLFPLGTTGEGPLFTAEERKRGAEWVVRHTAGRVPVIIHTGMITTTETIDVTRHARDVGADAAAVVPPYFYTLTEEALFDHFAAVAKAAPDFPIYLYNNPGVTPNALSTKLVVQLAESFENIIGLKDSGGGLATLFRSRELHGGAFNTASGPDGLILAAQAIGVDACVSGNANVAPELVVGIVNAAKAGDYDRARTLQARLDQVRAILADGADLSLYKAMCAKRGVPIGDVRAPLRKATAERIDACWEQFNDILSLPI